MGYHRSLYPDCRLILARSFLLWTQVIPFSKHKTASLPALNNRHRLKQYQRFIGGALPLMTLDMGRENFISLRFGVRYNTDTDLNRTLSLSGKYDVITHFEVIQHLMNPLLNIEECFRLLRTGGRMYIATPLAWLIPWYHGENFVEYKRKNLEQLFEYVGFRISKYEVHNPWPLRFVFYGVRPVFRVLFNRYQIWELVKS